MKSILISNGAWAPDRASPRRAWTHTKTRFGHFQTKTFQTSSGSGWAGEASATGAAQVRSRVGRAGAGFDAFRAKTLSTGSGGDWAGEAAAPGAAHVRSGVGRAGIWFGALRAGTLLGGSGGGSFGRLLVCLAPVLPWRGRAPVALGSGLVPCRRALGATGPAGAAAAEAARVRSRVGRAQAGFGALLDPAGAAVLGSFPVR